MTKSIPLTVLLILLSESAFFVYGQEQSFPQPDLSRLRDAIRHNLELGLSTIETIVSNPETSISDRAEAWGRLGQLLQAHDFRVEASEAYQQARTLDADDARWPYYLGFIGVETGKLENAVQQFGAVLKLNPDDVHAMVRLGHVLLDLNRAPEAAVHFEKAQALKPDSALILYGLGKVAAASGQYQEAVDHFEKALAIQPNATTIHYPLGMAYRRIRNMEKARHFLGQRGEGVITFPDPKLRALSSLVTASTLQVVLSMAEQADGFSARDFEGYLVANLAEKKGVVDYFKKALAHRTENEAPASERARLHFAIGVLEEFKGNEPEAMQAYQSATETDDAFLDAYLKVAYVHARAHRFEQELQQYQAVLDRAPHHKDALLNRARSFIDQGQGKKAIADLRLLITLDDSWVEPRLRLATLIQKTDPEQALAEYRALALMDMGDRERAFVHFNLGQLLQRNQMMQEAVEHYQQALSYVPDFVEARINLAGLYGFLNQYESAATEYGRIIMVRPQDERYRLGEAAAWVLNGDVGTAINKLEAALLELSTSQRLKHVLARLYVAAPDVKIRDGSRADQLMTNLNENLTGLEETRAMAHAQNGQWDDAVAIQQDLVQRAESGKGARLDVLREQLKRYQKQQMCCGSYGAAMLLPAN